MRLNAMRGVLVGAVCCAWLGLPVGVLAQAEAVAEHQGVVPEHEQKMVGVSACTECHAQSQTDSRRSVFKRHDRWILRDEALIWEHEDKHFQAFTVLLTEESANIGKRLYAHTDHPAAKVYEDTRCLACHTGVPVAEMEHIDGFVAGACDKQLYNIGVSCEGCHGPSGAPGKGWGTAHYSAEVHWRTMPPATKLEEFGYWDVRSPVSKTKICLSCHLGNVEQGKIITHEMYAAGHPPLPAFELASFAAQEPEHWRRLGDKDAAIRDKFLEQTKAKFNPADLDQTRELLIAALVTMSESLQLNLDLAAAAQKAEGAAPAGEKQNHESTPQWPELANYSCFACHHELQNPSWRQARMQRETDGRQMILTPGRPIPHEWPFSLASVAAQVAGSSKADFQKHVDAVLGAYSRQPFGDRDGLHEPIGGVIRSINQLATKLACDTVNIDGDRVLALIGERAADAKYDYDSSRQLVWAFERVYSEMKSKRNGPVVLIPPPEDQPRVPKYVSTEGECKTPGWPARQDLDDVEQVLAVLAKMLVLDLRIGDCQKLPEPALEGEDFLRTFVQVELSASLEPIGAYDPAEVAKLFGNLDAAVKKAP